MLFIGKDLIDNAIDSRLRGNDFYYKNGILVSFKSFVCSGKK